VTHGDPTWAGPLAGIALELPVFHIMEPEIMAQVDPAIRKEHLSIMEIALDVEKIAQGLNRVRNRGNGVSKDNLS
jgi:betaine reductase